MFSSSKIKTTGVQLDSTKVWKVQILGPFLILIKVLNPSPTMLVKTISCSPSPPLFLAQLHRTTHVEMVFQGHQNKILPKIK